MSSQAEWNALEAKYETPTSHEETITRQCRLANRRQAHTSPFAKQTHIIKPEFDALSDRSTVQWKTNDLKALGVIAGDVNLTYQVYIRGATTAADSWRMLEEQFNRNTLKNRLIVTKKLHNFKMESGTRFAVHVDQFKEIVLQMETIGEPLDEFFL
ncbi:hypothetical protein PR001_g19251 [Phytophthora rubi]|uniref:Uncharacterized protein n=3 Tax=Phytophthora TaxID=4783 RepID=A0A6A3JTN1_9STRA|nr:hypothetical protein PR001_g19251 [Phytophthora rubi]